MSATLYGDWHSNHNHGSRSATQKSNQDNKQLKAFVGVVLFVVIGFVLAELHPAKHTDSFGNTKTGQAIMKLAN